MSEAPYELHRQWGGDNTILATTPYSDVMRVTARALFNRFGPIEVKQDGKVIGRFTEVKEKVVVPRYVDVIDGKEQT